MFKLVVLSALVAFAVAKPGYLGGHLGYSLAPLAVQTHNYAIPSAISSTYRKDIVSQPWVQTYAAPVVAAPIIEKTILAPAAVSSTYRKDIVSKPIISTYAAPAYVSAPVVHKTIVSAPTYANSAPFSYGTHVPSVYAW
ncbi:unnamed protein product [Brassicogethes aeneus]|uniref:Uncharacterized protein n=1 Tax=Brassicogethes aeneus TaxID=1431903 RepID=A0A9P0FA38_BRAAE|nr:unnamed protein product [Brassicogethes aeneus]